MGQPAPQDRNHRAAGGSDLARGVDLDSQLLEALTKARKDEGYPVNLLTQSAMLGDDRVERLMRLNEQNAFLESRRRREDAEIAAMVREQEAKIESARLALESKIDTKQQWTAALTRTVTMLGSVAALGATAAAVYYVHIDPEKAIAALTVAVGGGGAGVGGRLLWLKLRPGQSREDDTKS